MTTKEDNCLLSKSYQNNKISSNDSQFDNLNLNQNQNSKIDIVGSKFKTSEITKDQNKDLNKFDKPSKKSSYNFFEKNPSNSISSEYSNVYQKENDWKKEADSETKVKNKILSLNVSAYKNENSLIDKSCNKLGVEKTSKNLKHNFGSTYGMFEIPRQQNDETSKEPEVMQFKSSQKLLNPNQTKFDQLKEKANKLFQEEKYNEAIEIYTEILQLSDLSFENEAVIYSNRSAYLMLKSKDSLEFAKDDAEKAIKCWPSWWKGYYRLARVHVVQENWNEAEQILHHASAMNSESKFVRDEISYVRKKTGMLSRQGRIIPTEKFKEATGMSEEEFRNVKKHFQSLPGIDDVMKGHQYCIGIEVQQDYKKAAEFYEKAANLGNPIGMYHLGLLYQDGNGVKRDFEESMKWLLKAANTKPTSLMGKEGIVEAQHAIAMNYLDGIGVNKDYRKAVEWFEKAVENGYAPSANNLGNLYNVGMGVEKSILKSFNYYKLAAEGGCTSAMCNLAHCYFKDVGYGPRFPSAEDNAEALKWLNLAANKGNPNAVEELNIFQENFNNKKERNFDDIVKKLESVTQAPQAHPLDSEQFGKLVYVKVPEFVQVVYGIIRWYNYRLYGPWNTILALNRFTGIFFYKKHKTIWSNIPFKIILLILFIYPFILGSHVLMNYKCLWSSYSDDNILICSNFYDSFVSYSNLFNAGISLFLGILTAFARKIKGQKWAKKQKFETYLLVQSIISTLFLCISESSTLIYSMVQNANSLKPFTDLQDFIVKAILISTTNWMGVFFHCSPTILIICLSKQIRESFISFYRLYFIPGIQNPKKTQILPINSLTQSR